MQRTDVIIIGAGPVGLFAVFQAGMLGMKSIVIDAIDHIGGQCTALYPEKPIYDIPAYPKILARDLIEQLSLQIKNFAPQFILGSAASNITKTDYGYIVETKDGKKLEGKVVVIAAGSGEFEYKRPPLDNILEFEGKSVFYSINDISKFSDKNIVISGGGDSAVDWAIELTSYAKHVHVIHRRDKFRCAPASYDKLIELSKTGNLTLHIPYQLHRIEGKAGLIETIEMIDLDNNIKRIKTDFLLPFYGLAMNLEKISHWGLELTRHLIKVDHSTMQSNLPGIYAIGDIAHYPGKLKLILCGFSEAAIAAHSFYNLVFPNKALHFEYSTTKGPNAL